MSRVIAIAQDDPKRRANTIIGERVHTLMWRRGCTQRQLADILHVDQGSISNRLRGKTIWSAVELAAAAAWLDVPSTELLPEMELVDPPDPNGPGGDSAPREARTPDLRIIIGELAA